MNQTKNNTQCKLHNEEGVAIDFDPLCDPNDKYFCTNCILISKVQSRNLISITNAEMKVKEAKDKFKQRLEAQSSSNITTLKVLAQQVNQLKNHVNISIEKLLTNIENQIQEINNEIQQMEKRLKTLDIQQYFQQNYEFDLKFSKFTFIKNIIKVCFDNFYDQIYMKECLQTLDRIDDQIILLKEDQKIQLQKQNDLQETPHLNLICQEHNKKIIVFDLSELQQRENRLACVTCLSRRPGEYKELDEVFQQWQEYQKYHLSILNSSKEKTNKKVEVISQSFEQIKIAMDQRYQESKKLLNQVQTSCEDAISKLQVKMNRNWLNLSKDQFMKIADTLSKPQYQSLLFSQLENQLNQQDDYIKTIICDYIKSFQENETLGYQLLQFTNNNTKGKQNFAETTTNNTIQRELNINKSISTIFICGNKTLIKLQSSVGIINLPYIKLKRKFKTNNKLIAVERTKLKKLKKINYQLQNQIKQQEWCHAIAINQKQTLMIAACDSKIRIFEFQQGQLKEKQVISEHSNYVRSLQFMKKSNQFVSGSDDKSVKIWCINDNQQWFCWQSLNGHSNSVNCVIVNRDEDTIISCSDDKSIKFWVKTKQWECSGTLKCHSGWVYCISLSESQNQLVSCGCDEQICIIKQNESKNWNVIQTIKEANGRRICFIDDNTFTFQSFNHTQMDVYKMNKLNNQFIKSANVSVEKGSDCQWFFPQIFNKEMKILLNKNGQTVNLIRRIDDTQFILEQQIKFENQQIFGIMSDDGEFIITWDYETKEIQVRRQQN